MPLFVVTWTDKSVKEETSVLKAQNSSHYTRIVCQHIESSWFIKKQQAVIQIFYVIMKSTYIDGLKFGVYKKGPDFH